MATIGKIDIAMGVQTAELRKGLATASAQVRSFDSGLGKLAAAAGGVLAVGGIAAWTQSSLTAIDATNDLAAQIGTTGDRLSELRYAAKLSGSETETLDNSLQKMTTVLGDAARDGGPAAGTLRQLGLEARDLIAVDPATAFERIAAAISTVDNPALQASAAVDVFGKSGVKLLNTLRAGPEEMERLKKEAQALGISVGGIDAAKVAQANDALDKLGFATQGLGNTLAVSLAPTITSVVETMTGWVASIHDTNTAVGTMASYVKGAFDTIAFTVRNAGSIWQIAQLRVAEFGANVVAVIDTLPDNFVIVTQYIGRNWSNLLIDMANAYIRYSINVVKNAVNLGYAIWDAVQGNGFTFEWTPLLDGFEATAEKFPDLIQPVWVSMADELEKELDKVAVNEARNFEKLKQAVPEMKTPAALAKPERATQLAGLADLGSKEAYSAIVKYQASGMKDAPLREVARTSKEQLAETKKQTGILRKLNPGASAPVYRMAT